MWQWIVSEKWAILGGKVLFCLQELCSVHLDIGGITTTMQGLCDASSTFFRPWKIRTTFLTHIKIIFFHVHKYKLVLNYSSLYSIRVLKESVIS
jgi:hypothetical protein